MDGLRGLLDLLPGQLFLSPLFFLLSMGLIAVTYALWRRTAEGDRPRRTLVPAPTGVRVITTRVEAPSTLRRATTLARAARMIAFGSIPPC